MQNQFYKWYRDYFNSRKETPPDDVWQKISQRLDKEQAGTSAPQGRNRAGFISLMGAIIVAAAYLWFADREVSSLQVQKLEPEAGLSPAGISTAPADKNHVFSSEPVPLQTAEPPVAAERVEKIAAAGMYNVLRSYGHRESGDVKMKDEDEVIQQRFGSMCRYPSIIHDSILTGSPFAKLPGLNNWEADPYFAPPTGFYIGTNIIVNNYWLLNYETYSGFRRSDPDGVRLNFGLTYAVLAGYRFPGNYTLQAEWIQMSKQGQKYTRHNTEGRKIKRDIELYYRQASLVLKKGHTRSICSSKKMLMLNTVIGGDVAFLHFADEVVASQNTTITDHYTKRSYGALAGVEAELGLSPSWILSLGTRGNVGLNNIFAGNERMPADFLNTRNASIGVYAGISFVFNQKD